MKSGAVNSTACIHPSADVRSVRIGSGTRVWQNVVILPGATIGENCNICAGCFIEDDVVIGNNVTVKNNVALYSGVRLESDVFIGPGAIFTNDVYPRSQRRPPSFPVTTVRRGASLGANATLVPGIDIGENAVVGAGAVVTQDLPAWAVAVGNPARICGTRAREGGRPNASLSASTMLELNFSGASLHAVANRPDGRGLLLFADFEKDLPFVPQRVFSLVGLRAGSWRGNHAHRRCEQFIICLGGTCRIFLDDGTQSVEIALDRTDVGLFVKAAVWVLLHSISEGAAMLVLASQSYDESDYIRSYGEFLEWKRRRP